MPIVFAWSLCLSVLVVLLSTIPLTLGRIKAGYSIENMSAPRALFDELPDFYSFIGIILIVASGIYIVFRENRKKSLVVAKTTLRT